MIELPRFSRQALTVWYRNYLSWSRFYKSSILLNFGEPLTNLLALGLGLGAYVTTMQGMSFVQFIAPGLLAVTAMNAVTFDSGFEGYDALNNSGVFQAMIASPLTAGDIVGGQLLWEATRALMYGLVFAIVVALFGLVRSPWALALPLPLAVTGMLFASPALWVATRAKTHEHLFYYFTLVITPMFMFSGVFFPVTHLPQPLALLIEALPLYHAVHLMRTLLTAAPDPSSLVDMAWLVGYTLLLLLFPAKSLSRRLST